MVCSFQFSISDVKNFGLNHRFAQMNTDWFGQFRPWSFVSFSGDCRRSFATASFGGPTQVHHPAAALRLPPLRVPKHGDDVIAELGGKTILHGVNLG